MNLIVAVDNNWAIGSKNELLIRIPNDHKHFREETTGKVVVLGRKTLETFPQGMPLKNRINIILSKDPNYQVKDAIVVHSIEELLEELKKYDEENIYIIGGESIYRQMLPYCDVAHVTKIDHAYEADAYFPDLDSDPEWEITADSDEQVLSVLKVRAQESLSAENDEKEDIFGSYGFTAYSGRNICGSQNDSVGWSRKFSQLCVVTGGSAVSAASPVLCISESTHQAAPENTGQVGNSREMGVAGGYRHCFVGSAVPDRHVCRNCLDLV